MRRALRPLAILVPLLVAGCGATVTTPVSVPRPAGAQTAPLGWVETIGPPKSRLVFRVSRFSVTDDGWSAALSFTNDTSISFSIVDENGVPNQTLGLMVFRTGAHTELEQRNKQGLLPVLRGASSFSPRLPALLGPHATWTGTASAHGALPAGFWIRFVFGDFVPKGTLPEALRSQGVTTDLLWITDRAYRLR